MKMSMSGTAPPSGVMESWLATTAPVEVLVVPTAKTPVSAMP